MVDLTEDHGDEAWSSKLQWDGDSENVLLGISKGNNFPSETESSALSP